MRYDFAIIGAGSAGIAAAIRANEAGASCLLVNRGLPVGGTCVNVGCVPSKAMIAEAENVHLALRPRPGVELSVKRFEFGEVAQATDHLLRKLRKKRYERPLSHLDNVSLVEAPAKFLSPRRLGIGGEPVEADQVLIATGSTATVPPVPGLEDVGHITHVEALSLQRVPTSLAIMGAGPLGLEFAQMFSRFGAHVTLLQRGPRVLPDAEPQLTDRLVGILEREGINVFTEVEVERVARDGMDKVVRFRVRGEPAEVRAEEIMLAAGKTANTASLDLDRAGVETDEREAVRVDATLRTSAEGVWAAGDVAALPRRLETTAAREGSLAAGNALAGERGTIANHRVPYTVFTDPQLASVGFTEAEQEQALGRCECRVVFFTPLPKAQILDRREGVIKMGIHPEERTVQGVHILAPNAGDLIAHAMTLVEGGVRVEGVAASYPVFPTLSEAVKYAALAFSRKVDEMPCCI